MYSSHLHKFSFKKKIRIECHFQFYLQFLSVFTRHGYSNETNFHYENEEDDEEEISRKEEEKREWCGVCFLFGERAIEIFFSI